ncbi:flagellar biosynthesis protein FlhF [Piscinibacter sakaiensis]|uniref:flagellar biosynthesis protein FlhF n=1 Tax=Piscinibacter sakaiensis TaxID=1547922 RepID=UPI003AAE4398
MNVKRFTARTSRDALNLVRQAFGEDAVVLSTKPCDDGIEVMAMAPESVAHIERIAASGAASAQAGESRPARLPLEARAAMRASERIEPMRPAATPVESDVQQLAMSTLSFQDYVRERMLKKREAEMRAQAQAAAAPAPAEPQRSRSRAEPAAARAAAAAPAQPVRQRREPPVLRDELSMPQRFDDSRSAAFGEAAAAPQGRRDQQDMMNELRSMKGLIEERFGALAFMEKMQRQPAQARLSQRLLDCGFSPALIRKLAEGMGPEVSDETSWAAAVLERNLHTAEHQAPLEDQGGVLALVGPTGVGKTTTTAKIAAAFATKHGAANLGLITLDAYRVAAHEQLRAYGRILGVPVHTAHDRASLEDLLELLAGKKMVLIDTAGMAQRDARTKELLEMLSHRSIKKLLVVNAAAQGETIEDVLVSYQANQARGIVLSKIDEAVKLGPALDAIIRHRLTVLAVANGQRVPEDWHRLSAHALVQRAVRAVAAPAWKVAADEVNLVFCAPQNQPPLRQNGRDAAMQA